MFDVKVVETRLSDLRVQPGLRTAEFSSQVDLPFRRTLRRPWINNGFEAAGSAHDEKMRMRKDVLKPTCWLWNDQQSSSATFRRLRRVDLPFWYSTNYACIF
jgi:hypothetical protein